MYKLVVVDDYPMEGPILQKMLGKTALPVEYAGQAVTGSRGLELAREIRPDIMIIDIKMPEMDGITLARHLKEEMPGIKVVMLTAYDDFDYIQQALRLGVEDYLLKPVSQEELEKVLGRVCKLCAAGSKPSGPSVRLNAAPVAAAVRAGNLQQLRACCERLFEQRRDRPLEEQEIMHLAKEVLQELEEGGSTSSTALYHTFIHDICLQTSQAEMRERFYSLVETVLRNRNPEEFSSSATRIMQAKAWIDEHLAENISLSRLASEVFLSSTYLSRLFKQVERTSFSDYVMSRRMERAKNLLLNTQDSVESISAQCGYDKPNSFWRIFKQKEGLSPAHYRAANKGG